MELPAWLGRFNKVVTNRVQGTYAWLVPGWVVICHRGRTSGRLYRTPVNAYKHGDALAVVLMYGEHTDWLRNVLAGNAQVVRAGRTHALLDPRVVGPEEVGNPRARAVSRATGNRVLVAELGAPEPGFGRGPRAD
jgi:deazaflavin-dependent oxidoreductase (nitroreductase family)